MLSPQMDSPLFMLGPVAVTPPLAALAGLVLLLAIALIVVAGRRRGQSGPSEHELRMQHHVDQLMRAQIEIAGRIRGMGEVLSGKQSELARAVSDRLDQVGQRVGDGLTAGQQATAEQLQKLEARLAVIDAAQQNIGSLSEQVSGLKAVLANRPARGAFGQGQMEAIVKDALPAAAYSFQSTLSTRVRPDCLIHLPGDHRPLAIDAKFPLEAFEELRRIEPGADEARALQRLRQDMIGHVQDVRKYLIPDETQDVVLLFVPSEALYAELHERLDDVIARAHRARVLIVSPSLLMLAIQLVQGLVRDAAMRDQAHLIQKEVALLIEDVGRLGKRVSNLKQHLAQTARDLEEIEVSAGKIERRGGRIEALDFDEATAPANDRLPNPLAAE
jgi:DNA recombination protein RmuC